MIKKLLGIAVISFTLAGCSSVAPAPKPTAVAPTVSYGIPDDCEIKPLVALEATYEAFDQTAEGAKDTRDCAIGVPHSDVGVFFGYSLRTKEQWLVVTAKLVGEGYKKWDAGIEGAEVWRMETGNGEEGSNCSLSGYVPGVSFSVTEPWTTCDDKWNKELVGYLVEHAEK